MARQDRFANVFTAELTMSAANTLTFIELNFAITLRDRIAIVIDELYIYPDSSAINEMTTVNDTMSFALTVSDQVANIATLSDRRILYHTQLRRSDFGTAASGQLFRTPLKESFAPPLISLPTRMYFAMVTTGLASAAISTLRMHFRTEGITQDQQLIEILESFQLST